MYEALVWARRERAVGRQTLDDATVETIFFLRAQAESVAAWRAAHHVRRVVIADFGKNIYATCRACRDAGLDVVAVADEREAFAGMRYRSIPILTRPPASPGSRKRTSIQEFVPMAQPVPASLCAHIDPGAKRVGGAVVLGVRDQQRLRAVGLCVG